MTRLLPAPLVPTLAVLAMLGAAPLAAQQPPALSLEQRMLVRCSAAFALVAGGQERGEAAALAYPAMAEDGREFFVRASARVMDETGLDRAGISALLSAEARELAEGEALPTAMRACLPLLDRG